MAPSNKPTKLPRGRVCHTHVFFFLLTVALTYIKVFVIRTKRIEAGKCILN